MAMKRGVENDPLVCFDCGLPRHRLHLHPYYTGKSPGKKRDDRIYSQSPRVALRAVVCRKAVSWELKWEVMHDPWVCRNWFHRSSMEGILGTTMVGSYHYWRYMIRLGRGVQWRSMARHDTGSTRSIKIKYKGYKTFRKGADHSRGNEVMESYGMIGINLGLVQDWLRAMKKSKTDQELVGLINHMLCCLYIEILNHRWAGSEKSLHGLGWAGKWRSDSSSRNCSDPTWKSLNGYKSVGRVDGELGRATSQLDQLEQSREPQVKWFSSASWMS
ncbi:Uncharacterized protein Rs2_28993 [Raphanus sativus]|nr:Uncharacterized protein Rs2_28993 [Raphanus sativus]